MDYPFIVPPMPFDTWAKCIGAVLLAIREQERGWTRQQAVEAARAFAETFDWKTARSIERGSPGVGTAKIDQYARALGLNMSQIATLASILVDSQLPESQPIEPESTREEKLVRRRAVPRQ